MSQFILTNIAMYDAIVSSHYNEYQKLTLIHDELSKNITGANKEEIETQLYQIQYTMDCEAAIIVAFGYMTIEAFCNAYLDQHIPRKKVEKIHFLKKLDTTISILFAENGKSVSKSKAQQYYGAEIQKLADMRNEMVHRHPVRFGLSLKSALTLQKGAAAATRQIEHAYLRRISRSDVKMAATAYTKLLDNFSVSGIDLSKLSFEYK